MLQVQEVRARGVGEEVEQAKDSPRDVGAPVPVVRARPRRELDDEGDEVETRGDGRVDEFLKGKSLDWQWDFLVQG